ncbi:MAG TPA: hypothetical protein DCE44_17445, partial [Verrucomicrobiales bacterium]|nr:hypothetical protein [Verrucomicrobiales bacterium]
QFKDPITRLKRFLATEHPRPEARGLVLDQAVRLPQFLDFVAENLRDHNEPLTVVVLGSPLYLDAKETGFSMVDGYFPSDGHLLAGRDQSVFGVKDRSGALSNVVVNFGYFGDPWVSEVHAEKVRRFWSLFLSQQQGRLGTFCADLPTVFAATQKPELPAAAEPRFQIDSSRSKIEMVRITRDLGPADWITRDTLPSLSQQPPRGRIGPMKIGIRWQADVDLDLYASPKRNAETLYFEHPRSAEGYYFKDHRSSPQREYEFIEFESPVDVGAVDARINFYEGETSRGPSGEVRIEFEGKIYSGPFSLEARHGNKGREGNGQDQYWARIDVPAILKLTDPRRDSARLRDR